MPRSHVLGGFVTCRMSGSCRLLPITRIFADHPKVLSCRMKAEIRKSELSSLRSDDSVLARSGSNHVLDHHIAVSMISICSCSASWREHISHRLIGNDNQARRRDAAVGHRERPARHHSLADKRAPSRCYVTDASVRSHGS